MNQPLYIEPKGVAVILPIDYYHKKGLQQMPDYFFNLLPDFLKKDHISSLNTLVPHSYK